MSKKFRGLSLLLMILGTMLVLLGIVVVYSWMKFITDPTLGAEGFGDLISSTVTSFLRILSFDFGQSNTFGGAGVNEILARFLPHTIILVFTVILFTALVCLGYAWLVFRGRPGRNGIMLVLSAMPAFILAEMIYVLFNGRFGDQFPRGIFDTNLQAGGWTGMIISYLAYLALPMLVLLLADGNLYHFIRLIRNRVGELKNDAVIEFKHLHGYSRMHIFLRHVLPHVILTLLNQLKFRFVFLISAAAVVETIFRRHGIGYRLIELAKSDVSDFNLLLAILYVTSILIIMLQLVIHLIERYYVQIIRFFHRWVRLVWYGMKGLGRRKIIRQTGKILHHVHAQRRRINYGMGFLLLVLIAANAASGISRAGSDSRLIKDGYQRNEQFSRLKAHLVDDWGNLDQQTMLALSKYKYMAYPNLMTMDLQVVLKATLCTALVGFTGVLLVLLCGLPAGIGLGMLKRRRQRDLLASLFIYPFDVIPKFFILAVLLRVFRYSPLYQSDILFLMIYISLLAFLHIPEFSKMISLYVADVRSKSYYIVGESIGAGLGRRIFVYIFRHIRLKVVIEALRVFISIVFLEAALSYFGFTVPVKKDLYFITLGQVIKKYATTLNFLSLDWAELVVKLTPVLSAALALGFILIISNILINRLIILNEE